MAFRVCTDLSGETGVELVGCGDRTACPSHRLGAFGILSSGENDLRIPDDEHGKGLVALHERFPPVAHLASDWGRLPHDALNAT